MRPIKQTCFQFLPFLLSEAIKTLGIRAAGDARKDEGRKMLLPESDPDFL